MEYKLSFPTLKFLCVVQQGSYMLNTALSRMENVQFPLEPKFKKWKNMKTGVAIILDNIMLPTYLKAQFCDIIMRLHFQAKKWVAHIGNTNDMRLVSRLSSSYAFNKFYFTLYGRIDKRKMLESYLESVYGDPDFDICYCYKLACMWCLDTWVHKIWAEMIHVERGFVYVRSCANVLVIYWSSHGSGDDVRLIYAFSTHCSYLYDPLGSLFENMAIYAAIETEVQAFEYFWPKLTDNEKAANAPRYAEFAIEHNLTDILCSALAYLKRDEQIKFIQDNAFHILQCFLRFPFDEFFIVTLEKTFDCMSTSEWLTLYFEIQKEVTKDFQAPDRFLSLLEHFWPLCTHEAKEIVLWSERKKVADSPRYKLISEAVTDIGDFTLFPRKEVLCDRCLRSGFQIVHMQDGRDWIFSH